MCGIAGIVSLSEQGNEAGRLSEMTKALHHRGPDDHGIEIAPFEAGFAGLAATRLAIRDLSARGHQPMVSKTTNNVLAFNGEIYNAKKLRRELEGRGRRFEGGSDTEVVLAAWDEWRLEAVTRLDGIFAFAVWEPASTILTLVRDPLGVKPLYIHDSGPTLTFGIRGPRASGGRRSVNAFSARTGRLSRIRIRTGASHDHR